MARLPRASVPTTPSAQCHCPLYPISPPLLSHSTRGRDGVRAGGAAGGSAPQGPRCPSAQRCPWPPQPGPWGHILLRVLALQPHSQHVFPEPSVCATHGPCGRKAQTCPPTRPLPTLLPDPQRKESELGFRASSPAGLSPVSACVPIGVQTPTRTPTRTGARSGATLPTWQVRGSRPSPVPAALPPLCPPPTPPTVRSSWGLKKEASYPRGSTCKEKQDSRHGRKGRHCLGLLREKKAKTLLILAKNKT